MLAERLLELDSREATLQETDGRVESAATAAHGRQCCWLQRARDEAASSLQREMGCYANNYVTDEGLAICFMKNANFRTFLSLSLRFLVIPPAARKPG